VDVLGLKMLILFQLFSSWLVGHAAALVLSSHLNDECVKPNESGKLSNVNRVLNNVLNRGCSAVLIATIIIIVTRNETFVYVPFV